MSNNFFLLEEIYNGFGIVQTFLTTTFATLIVFAITCSMNEKSVWMLVEGFLCAENWISLQRKMNFPFSALDFIR